MSAEAVHFNMHDAKTHLSRIIERVERGEEVIIDLNTEIAFWKIADMADGRFDVVLGAKDARNRPCFGWRLDHDEALAILGGHRHGLSATRVRAAPAD